MLSSYLKQDCIVKIPKGVNSYNEPIFEEITIKCRLIDKFKQISNEKGEIVVSSGIIQCEYPIKVGYLINGRKVISVTSMNGLDEIFGYKGYLQ